MTSLSAIKIRLSSILKKNMIDGKNLYYEKIMSAVNTTNALMFFSVFIIKILYLRRLKAKRNTPTINRNLFERVQAILCSESFIYH